jgi:anaphase-promoting complex subunit 6
MLKLNRGDQAKQCFMEALALDVKSFEQLMSGEMMTPDEGVLRSIDKLISEWEFIQGLAYFSQTPQDAQFVQLIYTARLRKYKHATEHALTRQRLVEEFGLGDNPDVLFSFADSLYANFQFADCFTITSRSRICPFVAIFSLMIDKKPVQDSRARSDPQSNYAVAYRVHVSPLPPPLQVIHSGA